MAEKVNLQQKIQQYRQANSKLKNLSDEKILSIMVKNGAITLTEEEQCSVFGNNKTQNSNMGLRVEKSAPKSNPEKTIYLQSGRKVVYSRLADGRTVMKYFGADGTQIKPDNFKKVEGQISISADGKTYTITKNGEKMTLQAKDPSKGVIDQNFARLNNEEKRLKKTKKEQGIIGKSWDWTKNTTGIGDGSDKAQKQIEAERKLLNQIKTGKISKKDFKEVTGVEYSKENLEKFKRGELSQATAKIDGYKEGQEMASDVVGDMISGIAAVGIYTAAVAAAPFTGGASIAVGVVVAGASASAIKTGIKYADAKSGGREYTADNLKKDLATGAFSGVLAPITGGMGGAVGKTIATKVGIQAVKQVGKEVAEEAVEQTAKGFVKTMLTNPTGYEYIGGNMFKRGLAFAAEAATDGAIGGAVDNAFRTAYDGGSLEDIGNSAVEGFVGGAIMSPVIGGGMKVAGKGAQKIFGKNNVDIDANGNRVRVNDDGTVVRIDENENEIPASATDAEIHIPKGVLASDSSRSTDEIVNTVHVQDNGIPRISETEKSLFKNLNGRNFSEENGKTFLYTKDGKCYEIIKNNDGNYTATRTYIDSNNTTIIENINNGVKKITYKPYNGEEYTVISSLDKIDTDILVEHIEKLTLNRESISGGHKPELYLSIQEQLNTITVNAADYKNMSPRKFNDVLKANKLRGDIEKNFSFKVLENGLIEFNSKSNGIMYLDKDGNLYLQNQSEPIGNLGSTRYNDMKKAYSTAQAKKFGLDGAVDVKVTNSVETDPTTGVPKKITVEYVTTAGDTNILEWKLIYSEENNFPQYLQFKNNVRTGAPPKTLDLNQAKILNKIQNNPSECQFYQGQIAGNGLEYRYFKTNDGVYYSVQVENGNIKSFYPVDKQYIIDMGNKYPPPVQIDKIPQWDI